MHHRKLFVREDGTEVTLVAENFTNYSDMSIYFGYFALVKKPGCDVEVVSGLSGARLPNRSWRRRRADMRNATAIKRKPQPNTGLMSVVRPHEVLGVYREFSEILSQKV